MNKNEIDKQSQDVVEHLDEIIYNAIKANASDIHFEATESGGRIRLRLDGILYVKDEMDKENFDGFIHRLKVMSGLNTEVNNVPQDGRIHLNVEQKPVDLRISVMPTVYGESVVTRILNREAVKIDIKKLHFDESQLAMLKKWQSNQWGGIFLSGPIGSGKTTTLYTLINELNNDQMKICTIEDPVEFLIPGLVQTQIDPRNGLTFHTALRAAHRADPDVIMVGELRDVDTAKLIFNAVLTGHLVFSVLHTETTTEAVMRLVAMGLDPFIIKSGLKGVINQRLVRKLCEHCKEKADYDNDLLKTNHLPKGEYYKAKGCDKCVGSGYRGRIPVYEFFELSEATSRLLMENGAAQEIRKQAIKEGMKTLWDDGVSKAQAGITSIEEVMRVLGSAEG